MDKFRLLMLVSLLLMARMPDSIAAVNQETTAPAADSSVTLPASLASSQTSSPPGGIARNLWEMTQQGGPIMWPIYGVFVLGMAIVIYQSLKIYFDRKRTPDRLSKHLAEDEMDDIWRLAGKHPDTHLGALISALCDIYRRNKNILALQEEIEGYLQSKKERFEVIRSFAGLLSDTAGALGLLGTVWGMYVTFMPGKLESQQIITGMGIALVTTLGGLVVSIILNFAIAWMNATFHARLEWVEARSYVFRDRFGESQTLAMAKHAGLLSAAESESAGLETAKDVHKQIPSSLKVLSGEAQSGEVGSELPRPYEIRVLDQDGEPIKKLPITFDANGSQVTFDSGQSQVTYETDSRGRARTSVRLGQRVGRQSIVVRVDGEHTLVKEFDIDCRPGLPDRLIVVSGNAQVAHPGEQLPEPFMLRVEDGFGNPVPGQILVLKVIRNGGRFANDRGEIELSTDLEGMVSTSFWLANKVGANAVRAWVKSRAKRKLETYFESMGFSRNAA